jgi:ABC-type phosphate/phosphonate transport system substrate-binding protein
MYDLPELRAATDQWWSGLARHFGDLGIDDAPQTLAAAPADRYSHWLSESMLFSQTCGYPLTHRLAGGVKLLGTPCYDAPGCAGPEYRSLIIVALDITAENLSDLASCRVAVNSFDSQSGWNALRPLAAALGGWDEVFSQTIESGSHALSADMVREGRADVAAIDCVTHALWLDVTPGRLAGTRVLEMSPAAPALPYITAATTPDDAVRRMRQGIQNAVADQALAAVRATLRIKGFEITSLAQYAAAMGGIA